MIWLLCDQHTKICIHFHLPSVSSQRSSDAVTYTATTTAAATTTATSTTTTATAATTTATILTPDKGTHENYV